MILLFCIFFFFYSNPISRIMPCLGLFCCLLPSVPEACRTAAAVAAELPRPPPHPHCGLVYSDVVSEQWNYGASEADTPSDGPDYRGTEVAAAAAACWVEPQPLCFIQINKPWPMLNDLEWAKLLIVAVTWFVYLGGDNQVKPLGLAPRAFGRLGVRVLVIESMFVLLYNQVFFSTVFFLISCTHLVCVCWNEKWKKLLHGGRWESVGSSPSCCLCFYTECDLNIRAASPEEDTVSRSASAFAVYRYKSRIWRTWLTHGFDFFYHLLSDYFIVIILCYRYFEFVHLTDECFFSVQYLYFTAIFHAMFILNC